MQFIPFALAFDPKNLLTIGMLVLVVVVFYFLLIRPQKKQEKEAQKMRDNMKVGDEITTIGGIVGKIVSLKDETVVIETTKDKTHIRFLRAAIRSVDVVAEDSHPIVHETPAEPAKNGKKGKKKPAVEPAAMVETPAPETANDEPAAEAVTEDAPADAMPAETATAAEETAEAPAATEETADNATKE